MDRVTDWKPGDVALVNGVRAIRTEDNVSWWTTSGRLSDPNVAHAHRLVVINAEDREQVERLRELAESWADRVPYFDRREDGDLTYADAMQAALREFATPKPPKMQEPSGIGAVIETKRGEKWVRCGPDEWRISDGSAFAVKWSLLNDPARVLSEGVPA